MVDRFNYVVYNKSFMENQMIVGVGVCDKGVFPARGNGKQTDGYITWKHMIERCYDPAYLDKFPTYRDCYVSEEFKYYQKFMAWAAVQKGFGVKGVVLDKDLLVKGNKVYSAEACVFIPHQINSLLTKSNATRGRLPIGVAVSRDKYMATLCYYGKNKNLGRFASPEEAFEVYKRAKEAHIKVLASQYKEVLDERAYVALQCYQVSLND